MPHPTTTTDHITLANTPTGDNEISCAHCGTRIIIVLPVPLAEWVRIIKSFSRAHHHCRPGPATLPATDQE